MKPKVKSSTKIKSCTPPPADVDAKGDGDGDNNSTSSSGSKSTLPPVPAIQADLPQPKNKKYIRHGAVGNGTFGTVYLVTHVETGKKVAMKCVFQDRRYKNRELRIMRKLSHPNIVKMTDFYFSESRIHALQQKKPEDAGTTYLHLMMEYIPENLYEVIRSYNIKRMMVPLVNMKLYAYQICRGVAYIHRIGICHRDIKPQNILVDRATYRTKLCDFGSAKKIVEGCPNIAYISSRYYRAPELILGDQKYSHVIDIWSTGCAVAEIFLGQPIFQGATSLEQLVEITKVLGIPSQKQIRQMCQTMDTPFSFPPVKTRPLEELFHSDVKENAIDLCKQMLTYNPAERLTPFEALAHPFFDELRTKEFLKNPAYPPVNNWTDEELKEIEQLKLGAILNPSGTLSKKKRAALRPSKESPKKASSKRSKGSSAADEGDDTKKDT